MSGAGGFTCEGNVGRAPRRQMPQEQLAFASKIDLTYLGGIERGRRNPSLTVMARIAEALGVSLPKLLSD